VRLFNEKIRNVARAKLQFVVRYHVCQSRFPKVDRRRCNIGHTKSFISDLLEKGGARKSNFCVRKKENLGDRRKMSIRLNNGKKIKTVIVTLLAATMIIGVLLGSVKATWPYYGISNPVFEEYIDDQGGAWDTVLLYYSEGLDLFSGSWRANLRIGSNQAWIDAPYFPASSVIVTSSSIISTSANTGTNPYGLPAGAVTIDMDARMVLGTTHLGLRGYSYVVSEPWVMKQTYTVINTGSDSLSDVAFYMYYFAGPYGIYPTNPPEKISHVDYNAGIGDPMGYMFDISMYGEGAAPWAYTGLSANVAPTAHDVGHAGGYPDPPYYTPNPPWRPSAIPSDVLRHVENDDMRNWASYDAPTGSDPNAVAGALKWCVGSLDPGAEWTITVLQSVAPHDAPIYMAVGKVTGGGQITVGAKAKASFGFDVMYKEGDLGPRGELQYVDQAAGIIVHGHTMTTLGIWPDKTKAAFTGKCTINGVDDHTFMVYVEDNGEPGAKDVFKITLNTGYAASGMLLNGNIQIHN